MGEDLHNYIALQDGSNDLTPASAPPRVRGKQIWNTVPWSAKKGEYRTEFSCKDLNELFE